mgnify:CR=1 FL=1
MLFYNVIIKNLPGSERLNLKLLKQFFIKNIHLSIFKRKKKKKTRKKQEKKKTRKTRKRKKQRKRIKRNKRNKRNKKE